jgi:hypothetical protein
MTLETILFVLAILGFVFIVVEVGQLYQLVRSQRRLTSIWETILGDPEYAGSVASNFIFGFIKDIQQDKAKETEFYALVQVMAAHATSAIKSQWNQVVQQKAPKTFWEAAQRLMQLPQVSEAVEKKLVSTIGADAVETVAGAGWG